MSYAPQLAIQTDRHRGHNSWRSRDFWERMQTQDAIALYERALDRDPTNHFLLFDLARAYAGRGEQGLAEEMLQRVLQLYPHSATVHFQAAQLYRRINLSIAAIKCLRRVLELEPQHPQSTEILVAMSMLAGRYGTDRRDP